MNWVSSDPPSYEAGCIEQTPSSSGRGICVTGPTISYRHKLHEVAHMPMVPSPITLPSFSHPASWGVPSAQLTERGETQVCCTDYLALRCVVQIT